MHKRNRAAYSWSVTWPATVRGDVGLKGLVFRGEFGIACRLPLSHADQLSPPGIADARIGVIISYELPVTPNMRIASQSVKSIDEGQWITQLLS